MSCIIFNAYVMFNFTFYLYNISQNLSLSEHIHDMCTYDSIIHTCVATCTVVMCTAHVYSTCTFEGTVCIHVPSHDMSNHHAVNITLTSRKPRLGWPLTRPIYILNNYNIIIIIYNYIIYHIIHFELYVCI